MKNVPKNILLLPFDIVAGICIIKAIVEKSIVSAAIAFICIVIIVVVSIVIDKSNR